jgi:phospholipase/carboxylesterase
MMTTRRLGDLQTLVVPGDDHGLVLVMCHGFGADARDLAPLADVVDAPHGTTWLFPDAPIQVPIGAHTLGRAWFPIDMVKLQVAMLAGTHREMAEEQPPQLIKGCQQILAAVEAYGVPLRRVVFAGFSQGAMVATAAALHATEPPAGLAILSGTLIDAATWRGLAPNRKGLPMFQSHGTLDPLLDVDAARKLHILLTEAGLVGKFHAFAGAHEIPTPILQHLGAWLRSLPVVQH